MTILSRLAAATGPDRELDGKIWCAVNGYTALFWDGAGQCYQETPGGNVRHHSADLVKRYTGSIDAAWSLVPANATWRVGHFTTPDDEPPYSARVDGPRYYDAWTAPLALCIAALRARGFE